LVEFIYFWISYDNFYSPLSFFPLPAPRSPLQAPGSRASLILL
jgi:hypothetical protein